MLFAFTISAESAIICALAGVVAFAAVAWVFRKDTEIEKQQRAFMSLCQSLGKLGFKRLSKIAGNLAIKDISGVYAEVGKLVDLCEEPEMVMAELRDNFFFQLSERLKREADVQEIIDAVVPYLDVVDEEE